MIGSFPRTGRRILLAAAIGMALAAQALGVDFETERLTVPGDDGAIELLVEIADTSERRARGYMERTDILPHEGMLFIYERPREILMWMANTPTALDMIFLKADGTIVSIEEDTTPFSRAVISSGAPARYVLEVLAGSSRRWGLQPGDRLEGPRFR